MKVSHVVLGGLDNTVNLPELHHLAQKHPFAVWGIAFNLQHEGSPRCPSAAQRKKIEQYATEHHLCLSALLAGQYLENVLTDQSRLLKDLPSPYQHIQLNFGLYHGGLFIDWPSVEHLAKRFPRFSFAVQFKGAEELIPLSVRQQPNLSLLFDASCGHGTVPQVWPKAVEGMVCGYAGGFSCDNIRAELARLSSVCGNKPVWLGAESGLRNRDNNFCIQRADRLLAEIKHFVR